MYYLPDAEMTVQQLLLPKTETVWAGLEQLQGLELLLLFVDQQCRHEWPQGQVSPLDQRGPCPTHSPGRTTANPVLGSKEACARPQFVLRDNEGMC